ncbi:MAG TPA: M23 family metallopeptidase [Candidatus Dormibacteraeota bacterium]|jgi:murein DD-endopeptidase MepM/ murein hydrolase activator NlpD
MSLRLLAIPFAAVALMAVVGGRPQTPGSPSGLRPPDHLVPPLADWVMTQPYGCTSFELEPIASWCASGHFHSGVDMAAPAGTAVHAAAAGRARVAWSPGGYGRFVILDHGAGISTLYAHLESTGLLSGDDVQAGAEIGRVGSTGLSTGPHLHFEVRRDGRPADPTPWLPASA